MNKKYYKLPAAILSAGLSPRAILLYAILADRSELSEKGTAFKDKEGTYIIFRIEEICTTLGVGERTAKYMLAELEDSGIIKRRKQGHGKPQKIYVQDIENMRKNATQKTAPQEVQKTAPQEVQKTAPQEVQKTARLINNNTDNNNTDQSSSAQRLKSLIDIIESTSAEMGIKLSERKIEKLMKRIRKRSDEIGSLKAYLRTAIRNADLLPEPEKGGYEPTYSIEEYEKTSILDYEDEE